MNFRDIQGFESPRALYEFVSIEHKLNAASMDDLIRCVAEIQRRALAEKARRDLVLDKMHDLQAELGLYDTEESNAKNG